jgi:transketolase
VLEILTTLYFTQMDVDPANPLKPDRDRLVLGKGHAAPALYRVLAEKGFFPVEEMATLRCLNTRLQGHPCPLDTPGVDITSGPLGIGLSAALGMALALKLDNIDKRVYCVMGDGEINEGTVWEGLMAAVKFKADNLCAILDWNGVQLDGLNEDIMPMHNLPERFASFGWHVIQCDGHDVEALYEALETAKTVKGVPTIILAHTVKGKGVSFMEGKNGWHGKAIDDASYEQAMKELGGAQ